MEAVIFEGKEYIKASVLATRFRYTADYLGQLCRAKKVDARLVGRAWYINLDSLNQHKDSRYKTPEKTEPVVAKKAPNHYLSRIDVEPVLKKKTVSLVKSMGERNLAVPVKYEADENILIPRVNKSAVSRNIQIDQAGAESVRIKKEGPNSTSFQAEELPEVYLKGVLKVEGLSEAFEVVTEAADIEPEIKPERMVVPPMKPKVMVRPLVKRVSAPVKPVETLKPKVLTLKVTEPKIAPKVVPSPAISPVTTPAPVLTPKKLDMVRPATPSFTPEVVAKRAVDRSKEAKTKPGMFLPLMIFLGACFTTIAVLGTRLEITVSKGSYDTQFVFEISKIIPR